MAFSRKLLQDIRLLVEIAHVSGDLRLGDSQDRVVLAEKPARVVLQLAVGVAQELELQTAEGESMRHDMMDIPKEAVTIPTEVVAFVVYVCQEA